MATKLAAAKKVVKSGVAAIVFAGKVKGNLTRVMAGELLGTLFFPAGESMILTYTENECKNGSNEPATLIEFV